MWSIVTAACNVATSLIPLVMTVLTANFGWRLSFVFVGLWSLFMSLLLAAIVRNNPKEVGLDLSDYSSRTAPQSNFSEQRKDSTGTGIDGSSSKRPPASISDILNSQMLWLIGIEYLLNSIVRTGIEDWQQLFLMEAKGRTQYEGINRRLNV